MCAQTASLVFGFLRNKEEKKDQKKVGGPGSGEAFDETVDSDSDESEIKVGYFDPPVERFAFVNKYTKKRLRDDGTSELSNISRSIIDMNQFVKKKGGRKSAGTGNNGDNSDNSASDMSDLSNNSD